eukprot:SAG31_NODE_19955_length_587_cov_1.524590_1_plen_121_part_10
MFEKVGVGFGAAETHRVALAVKKLGQNAELALESVRFWGKIFGTQADYLVCECKGGADEEAEEGEPDPMVVPPDAAGTVRTRPLPPPRWRDAAPRAALRKPAVTVVARLRPRPPRPPPPPP